MMGQHQKKKALKLFSLTSIAEIDKNVDESIMVDFGQS